ncbi:creatininase family protein [Salinicoccus hispanicus]|uniref:Creatininase family protein n=1 Tax=Salinicoccus hispanicus TaxID=157225 RepID=A0A6N8TZR4_9STAP|nr:creatininase family protein [Salinicoccus hispanicus]MXQ51300.1 creatininase family protein [Salinicoccus hispanicus]
MNKHALHLMTWPEIKKEFEKNKVIFLPLGSMEQHGEHSINGDFLAATHVAEKVAERSDNLYAPTLPFGNSNYFKSFPGTISLREETVTQILFDIIENFIDHEQYKIVFLNGHAGNKSSINNAVRTLGEEHKNLEVYTFNLWQTLTQKQKQEMYPTESDPSGHGAEPLTSIMRYLYPEHVDASQENFERNKRFNNGNEILNLNQMNVDGVNVDIYVNMQDISEDGIYSNTFEPSKEIGEKAIDYIVDNILNATNKIYGER